MRGACGLGTDDRRSRGSDHGSPGYLEQVATAAPRLFATRRRIRGGLDRSVYPGDLRPKLTDLPPLGLELLLLLLHQTLQASDLFLQRCWTYRHVIVLQYLSDPQCDGPSVSVNACVPRQSTNQWQDLSVGATRICFGLTAPHP